MDRNSTLDRASAPVPAATHEILGGGGVKLHAREWGNPGGPALLFIHGWSQSDLCWLNQVRGELAETFRIVTFDLRGHGLSDKPAGPEHYADGQVWAGDVASVIGQTGLEQPVLVAWSYGGYIVADYLRAYGDTRIGGINLVDAAVILRPPAFDHIGPGLLENAQGMCVPDLSANIAATRRFLRACTFGPLGDDEAAAALAWNMVVPSTSAARCCHANSMPATSSRESRSPFWSRTGRRTRSCCLRWPNTPSPSVQPRPRRGTPVSATCRSGRRRTASPANSPGWHTAQAHDYPHDPGPVARPPDARQSAASATRGFTRLKT